MSERPSFENPLSPWLSLAAVLAVQAKNAFKNAFKCHPVKSVLIGGAGVAADRTRFLRKVAEHSPGMQTLVLAPPMIQASPLIHCLLKSFVLKTA